MEYGKLTKENGEEWYGWRNSSGTALYFSLDADADSRDIEMGDEFVECMTPEQVEARYPMAATHTPGPWSNADDSLFVTANGKLIADCTELDDGEEDEMPEGERVANAHLIAASPELYTARMGSGLANELRAFLIGDTLEVFNEWYERHSAAIKKARGEA